MNSELITSIFMLIVTTKVLYTYKNQTYHEIRNKHIINIRMHWVQDAITFLIKKLWDKQTDIRYNGGTLEPCINYPPPKVEIIKHCGTNRVTMLISSKVQTVGESNKILYWKSKLMYSLINHGIKKTSKKKENSKCGQILTIY